jgi:hypothetical protein
MAEEGIFSGAVELTHKINEGLLKRLQALETARTVKVGVINSLAEKPEGGHISMAALAQVHEFGTTRAGKGNSTVIPERSFIRATGRIHRKEILKFQKELLNRYVEDKITIDKALKALGEDIVRKIKAYIMAGISPPWAQSTINERLSRKSAKKIIAIRPLVDTGQLYRSIRYQVEE